MRSNTNIEVKNIVNRVMFILAVLLFLGCTQYVDDSIEVVPLVISEDSVVEEAEQMTLFISGELYPPEELFDQIFTDLVEIRNLLGNDEFAQIRFVPRWEPGCVVVAVDLDAADEIKNNWYKEWDELHDEIKPSSIMFCGGGARPKVVGEYRRRPPNPKLMITFPANINPIVLADIYESFIGVLNAGACWNRTIDPNIYVKVTSNGIEYLFAKSSGNSTRYTRYLHVYYSNGKIQMEKVYLKSHELKMWE